MTMSDPLGDMLTRIRNGQRVNHPQVECPYSKVRESVCNVLQEEGYIRGFSTSELEGNKKIITIELKYAEGEGAIREIKRVSRPGCRVYAKIKDLQPFRNGLGINVISTPRGVMPDHKARNENVGGEVLCQVY